MINLLIVDDELHALEAVEDSVDWQKIGINDIYTARNIKQAKEIFKKETVQIMLCDIEMPQGSGLELLSWARENNYNVKSIFLTCHAEFNYAQKALELGSLDYILKPILPEKVKKLTIKAINEVKEENKLVEFKEYGHMWLKHKSVFIERFWLDIIKHKIPATADAIQEAAEERNILFNVEKKCLPILINIQRWRQEMDLQDEKEIEEMLKGLAEQKILKEGLKGIIVQIRRGTLLIIAPVIAEKKYDINFLNEVCNSFVESFIEDSGCDLSCYIGKEVFPYQLPAMVKKLLHLEKNNVALNKKVLLLGEDSETSCNTSMPNMDIWSAMLQEGDAKKVIEEVREFFDKLIETGDINADILQQFQQNFLQVIYTLLKQEGIKAHRLLNDDKLVFLYERATRSVQDMLIWIERIVDKTKEYSQKMNESLSTVDVVKKYITQHLDEKLSCEEIADYVGYNPDYLNRLFKKDNDITISDYLLSERVKMAKELLEKTDMQISDIVLRIGYKNFSYFSKLFKKHEGMTPSEYRKKCEDDFK